MASNQTLHPLFGEFITELSVAKGQAHAHGLTALPSITFGSNGSGGYKVTLGPNSVFNLWAWKTKWSKDYGAVHIYEDGTVDIDLGAPPSTGNSRRIIIVGRWKYVPGTIGLDGHPTGVLDAGMKATYEAVQGTEAPTPSNPAVTDPDGSGKSAVLLGQITYPHSGTPTWAYFSETKLDLRQLGVDIANKHSKSGTEIHTGAFRVTGAPSDPEDVLRLTDITDGIARPFANIAGFYLTTGPISKPYASGNTPVSGFTTILRSGLGLHQLSGGGFQADQAGVYRIAVQQKGSGSPVTAYANIVVAVKRDATPGDGYAEKIIDSLDFFASGKSEGTNAAEVPVWLNENDIVGVFCSSAETGNKIWFTAQNLGDRAPADAMSIANTDFTIFEDPGETFPSDFTFNLVADNALGAVTWSIDAHGAGQIDGTTEPKAEIVSGHQCKITFGVDPSAPQTYGIKLRATDSLANVATKTINVDVEPPASLTIPTGDQHFTVLSSDYPYTVNFTVTATGGTPPYTWALVAGADTTLPSAAINSSTGVVTGTASAAGTWKVRAQATDSAGTPAVVEKVINIVVDTDEGGGGGGGCFTDAAFVLMADGKGKRIASVSVSEYALTVPDYAHQSGIQEATPSLVKGVKPTFGKQALMGVQGLYATLDQRWGVQTPDGGRVWTRTDKLTGEEAFNHRAPDPEWFTPHEAPTPAGEIATVWMVHTEARTFFVGPTEDGPWFLVHNYKMP